jgi:hypothetical protein
MEGAMEQSIELQELYRQICEAQSKGDQAFFEHHFSQEEGVVAIGTDPVEWWFGYDTITRVFSAQLQESGGFEILPDQPPAYQQGMVGWLAGQPVLKLADGTEIAFRLSVVFQKEEGGWKIVQWHSSMGIPNEESISETLTTI